MAAEGSQADGGRCSPRRGFRAILTFSLVGFLISFGFSLVTPVLPLYALTFGVSLAMVGALVASIGITKVLLDIPVGVVADRVGTRRFMLLGLATVTVSAFVSALAVNYWMLLVGMVLQGVGSAIYFTTSYLAVTRLCPTSRRGKYLGMFISLQFLGSTSGPLLGGLFGQSFGLGTPFLAYGALTIASTLVVAFLVDRSLIEGAPGGRIDVRQIYRSFRNYSLASINLGMLSITIMRMGLISTILPVFAIQNLGLTPVVFGGILTFFSFTNFVTLLPVGSLTDRFGRRPFMFASLLLTGLLALLIPLTDDALSLAILLGAMGITFGLTGSIGAWVTDVSAGPDLGASMGVFRTMGDLGAFAGPIVLTFFLPVGTEAIGVLPFILAGGIMIAASVPLLRARDPARERAMRARAERAARD